MARGRGNGNRAPLSVAGVPPPLKPPSANQRGRTHQWHGLAGPSQPDEQATALFEAFNDRWRVRGGSAGPYSNGREQGYRITRHTEPAVTVWFSENRNSDDIVAYFTSGAYEVANPFDGDLPDNGDQASENRRFFRYDAHDEAEPHIAQVIGAERLSSLVRSAQRDQVPQAVAGSGPMPSVADFMNRR